MKTKFFLFVYISILFFESKAQNSLANIGFELGNTSGWTAATGQAFYGAPIRDSLYNIGPFMPLGNAGILHNSGFVSGTFIPYAAPCGGNFSIALYPNSGPIAMIYRYPFLAPSNSFQFSFQFAPLYFNSTHQGNYYDNSFYTIMIKDSISNVVIQSLVFELGYGMSVFYTSPANWINHSFTINGFGSKKLILEIINAPCAYGGHGGPMLFDVTGINTNMFTIQPHWCPGNSIASLSTSGCFEKYYWYDSTLITLIDSGNVLTLNPAPLVPTWFACIGIPNINFPNVSDTIWQLLTPIAPPTAFFNLPDTICKNYAFPFLDSSTTSSAADSIISWYWNFNTANVSIYTSNNQNPIFSYDSTGIKSICLHVGSQLGCMPDTFCKTIYVTSIPVQTTISASLDTLYCLNQSTTLSFAGNNSPNSIYQWILNDTAIHLQSGSLSTALPITCSFSKYGLHTISLLVTDTTVPNYLCNTQLITYPIIVLNTNGLEFFGQNDTAVCHSQSIQLNWLATAICGATAHTCSSTQSYAIGSGNGSALLLPTPFQAAAASSKIKMLYTSAELNAAGMQAGYISDLSFNIVAKFSTIPYANFSIYLACTSDTSLNFSQNLSDSTLVYYSSSYLSQIGVNNFHFSSSYLWDGVSNIAVVICFQNSLTNNNDAVKKMTTSAIRCVAINSGSNICNSPYNMMYYERPNISFKSCNGLLPSYFNFNWQSSGLLSNYGTAYPIGSADSTINIYQLLIYNNTCLIGSLVDTIFLDTTSQSIPSVYYINICSGDSIFLSSVKILTSSGIFLDTLLQCNIVDTYYVSPATSSLFNKSDTICYNQLFVFNGSNLNVSGIYLDTLINYLGCDSILTLNLFVLPFLHDTVNISICSGDSIGHILPSSSGFYVDTFYSKFGCDSLITWQVNLILPTLGSISDTICNTQFYFFNGTNLNLSGIYYDTLPNYLGCDSMITLSLLVLPYLNDTIAITICSGDSIGNIVPTSSGFYVDTFYTSMGCDSLITWQVNLLPPTITNIFDTICFGQIYQLGNVPLTTSGYYFDTLNNLVGCDSIISLSLIVITLSPSITLSGNQLQVTNTNATIQWFDCNTMMPLGVSSYNYLPTYNGNFAIIATQNNCSDTSACFPYNLLRLEPAAIHSIKIVPNPTTSKVSIYNTDATILSVCTILGTEVFTLHLSKNDVSVIDLESYPAGIYLFKLKNTNELSNCIKVIKY
jgi:hypothetical protein